MRDSLKTILLTNKFFSFPPNFTFAAQHGPMELKYSQQIATTLNLSLKQIESISNLHDEGSTIPFIARYRKEATGNLDEVVIGNVIDQLKYFTELEKRKETVVKTIEEAGKMTPALAKRIPPPPPPISPSPLSLQKRGFPGLVHKHRMGQNSARRGCLV